MSDSSKPDSRIPITSDVPLGPPEEPPNPIKEDFLKRLREEEAAHFVFATCSNEHRLLRVVEYDDAGKPTKWHCPECRRDTQEPLMRMWDPKPCCYGSFTDEEEEKIEPQRVANDIAANYLFITDRLTQTVYRYNDKKYTWTDDGEIYLQEILVEILANHNGESKYKNILHCLKSVTYEEIENSKQLAACENGLLDVRRNILTDFTPNEFVTSKLTVSYKPDAKYPIWEKFIDQVCPEDKDALQELAGYCLLRDYPIHIIFWLLGIGRNGKGVFTRTLEGMLGQENCSSIPLDQLDGKHRFALARLRRSLLNISSEPRTDKILQTELLKSVTGQDTIGGEHKGKQEEVRFRSSAKMVVVGNRYPKVTDNTVAFWGRLVLIDFPNQFVGKDQIQNLEKKWLDDPEEKSGILNWMLEGLHRLLSNRGFTTSKTQTEQIIQFKRASDSIGAFQTEIGLIERHLVTTRAEAFGTYKQYCELIGVAAENDKVFTQRMKQLSNVKDTSKTIDGKKSRVWLGFGLKELPKEEDLEDKQQKLPGTDGTDGTGANTPYTFQNNKKVGGVSEGVPGVPSVPETTAKDCVNFHLASCEHPNPDCLTPLYPCPGSCGGFKAIEGSAAGGDECGTKPALSVQHTQSPREVPVPTLPGATVSQEKIFPCPECKARGRKMQFSSEQDLAAHISLIHQAQGGF